MRRTFIAIGGVAVLMMASAAPALADSGKNTSVVIERTIALHQYRQGCDERVLITGTWFQTVVHRTTPAGTSAHGENVWQGEGVGLTTGRAYEVKFSNTWNQSGLFDPDTPRPQVFPSRSILTLKPEGAPTQTFHSTGNIVVHWDEAGNPWTSANTFKRTTSC